MVYTFCIRNDCSGVNNCHNQIEEIYQHIHVRLTYFSDGNR